MSVFMRFLFLALATFSGLVTAVMVYSYFTITADDFVVRADCPSTKSMEQCNMDAKLRALEASEDLNITVGIVSLLLCFFFLYMWSKFRDQLTT